MPGDLMMGEIIFKGRKRTRKSGILGAKEGRYGEIVGTRQYLTLESNVFPCVCFMNSPGMFDSILLLGT